MRAQTDESRKLVAGEVMEFSIPEDAFSILRR
jgi:hypothetical protein